MATEKAPTKAELLEALSKKGINSLEDLVDAVIPETGGFVSADFEFYVTLPTVPGQATGRSLQFTWLDEHLLN